MRVSISPIGKSIIGACMCACATFSLSGAARTLRKMIIPVVLCCCMLPGRLRLRVSEKQIVSSPLFCARCACMRSFESAYNVCERIVFGSKFTFHLHGCLRNRKNPLCSFNASFIITAESECGLISLLSRMAEGVRRVHKLLQAHLRVCWRPRLY